MSNIISIKVIATKILEIRGKKVILDSDLAKLYGVETKHLTRQVRRNIKRFPSDFMIQLTRKEYQQLLRCQIGTLEMGKYSKYLPYAFTEQGIAMLSSVLNSERAIMVNIVIMRAFVNRFSCRLNLTPHPKRYPCLPAGRRYTLQPQAPAQGWSAYG